MGNIKSTYTDSEESEKDIWWNNPSMSFQKNSSTASQENKNSTIHHYQELVEKVPGSSRLSDANKEKLNEFKLELARKHEKRREIIAEKRREFQKLKDEIQNLKAENEILRNNSSTKANVNDTNEEILRLQQENEALRRELQEKSEELIESEELHTKNNELRKDITLMQCELQRLNKDIVEFETERHDYQAHVVALKDVIKVSKQMLQIRESQLKELKEKVEQIEASLQGREMNILSQDLRNEYERQLQNIRNLRTLYEERQRTDRSEKQELKAKIEDMKKELERYEKKHGELEERVVELEEENSKKYDEIMSLESNLGLAKAETRQYQAELTVINQLFSEILLGFTSSQEIDLDKLTRHLEEHHDLLKNIVINEISPEVASVLPKVLLDLVNQVNSNDGVEGKTTKENLEEIDENVSENLEEPPNRDGQKLETIVEESESQTSSCQLNSPQEIVELLPKVWRVLIELLSHQKAPANNIIEDTNEETKSGDPNACYKTVQTPKGPSLVLSVSQTFIRLKDLILEKKSLEKEMGHLKHLNTHLENRLVDQEKRLELVSSELSKTWHVVGKLQKQHQLLHTQEKILRYELAQKRKLLTTLKEELECSREKRQQAREKNSNTEREWRQLRVEFASRRSLVTDDFNNSTESGYSDERASSSDDEADGPGYETDVSECTAQNTSNDNENEDTLDETERKLDEEVEDIETDVGSPTEPRDPEYSTTTEPTSNLELRELNSAENLPQEYGDSTILEDQSINDNESCSSSNIDDLKSARENELTVTQDITSSNLSANGNGENTQNVAEDVKPTITDKNEVSTSYVVDIYDSKQRQIVQYVEPRALVNTEPTNAEQEKPRVPANNCDNKTTESADEIDQSETEANTWVVKKDTHETNSSHKINEENASKVQESLERKTAQNQTENEETVNRGEDFNDLLFCAEELLETKHPRKIVDHVGELSSFIENLECSSRITASEKETINDGIKDSETCGPSLKEMESPPSASTSTDLNRSNTAELRNMAVNEQEIPKIDNTKIFLLEQSLRSLVNNPQPSTSTSESSGSSKPNRTFEEHLAAKEERLKRLEGQCNQLVKKVTDTSNKRLTINSRLDSLHEVYGENSQSSNSNDDQTSSELNHNNESKSNDDNQE